MASGGVPFPTSICWGAFGVCCIQSISCSFFFLFLTTHKQGAIVLDWVLWDPLLITHPAPKQLEAGWAAGEAEAGRTQPALLVLRGLSPHQLQVPSVHPRFLTTDLPRELPGTPSFPHSFLCCWK